MDRNQEGAVCPKCEQRNETYHLKFMYISMNEMVLKCESSTCLFPFKNFKYKDVRDGSISTPKFLKKDSPQFLEPSQNQSIGNPQSNSGVEVFNDTFPSELLLNEALENKELSKTEPCPEIEFDFSKIFNTNEEHNGNSIDLKGLEITEVSKGPDDMKPTKVIQDQPPTYVDLPKTTEVKREFGNVKQIKQEEPIKELKFEYHNAQTTTKDNTKDETTTATISRYLDFITAKHKKTKTTKSKTVKVEKEIKVTNILNVDEKKTVKPRVLNRPLDILRTIQSLQ